MEREFIEDQINQALEGVDLNHLLVEIKAKNELLHNMIHDITKGGKLTVSISHINEMIREISYMQKVAVLKIASLNKALEKAVLEISPNEILAIIKEIKNKIKVKGTKPY